ncbi:Ig-like domain-containing protein [Niabella beijingensis]|uniref:Ig-like domain-containing protein n=1 Tax=Niabella beijingensis TaxID=2872700 RepID=UPI001CC1292C|nr:Ig-like domain-containing protein [Niabella beijingensis]MBZ4188235.1 cadherin-like domain-containing protein [Niabella beijingensis]
MRFYLPLKTAARKAALCVFLLTVILSNGFDALAQVSTIPVNQYTPWVNTGGRALTTANSPGLPLVASWNSSSIANAVDGTLTNKATWSSLVSLGGLTQAWLEVKDPNATGAQVYPAGSYAGFVIDDYGVLDLANTVTITTYLGSDLKETYTVDGSVLSVSLLGGGMAKVGFITQTSAFDRVRITFNVVGVATSRSVYYAEILRPQAGPVPACNTNTPLVQTAYPATVITGTTGVANVNLLGGIFSNTGNVVDANTGNAATIALPVGALSTAYLSVKEAGAPGAISHPAGYFAGFEVANSSLLGLGLLSNSKISTYLDGALQEEVAGNNLLLSAPLLNGSGRSTIGFVTTKNFNEVRYTLTQPLNVNLGTTSVYAAVIKRFCAGTLDCNTLTPMSASTQPVYIDAANTGFTGAVCASCNFNGIDNVIDGNPATSTTMTLTAGLGTTGSLAVADAVTTYTAGTFAGFDIQVSTLAKISVPDAVRIELLNNGTVVQAATGPALLAGVSSALLSGQVRLPVGVIAKVPFDEVKISFNSLLDVNLGSVQIYDAVWQRNCETPLPCNTTSILKTPDFGVVIDGALTGFNGLVGAGSVVRDPQNLINASNTDFARIEVVAGAAAQGSIAVAAGANTFPGGTYAGFIIRDNNSPILLADLLKGITIETYNDGVLQETKTDAQLLGLTVLLPILGEYGVKDVGFITTLPYDEIRISVGAVVGASLPRSIDVFGATVDTRYVVPGTPGLNCPLFITAPDINYTTINKPVDGNVATNDRVPAGSTYSNATQVPGANGGTMPTGGTINLNADGTYTFTATTAGVYSYNINVCSNTGYCELQNLTITVTDPSINTNKPVVNTDIITTSTGQTVASYPILANDHASNTGGTLGTPTITGVASHGTATINGDGTLRYVPEIGFVGKDTVIYKVCETPGTDLCGSAYVFIEVKPGPINTTTATDDFNQTGAGVAVTGNVKLNDIDAEGDPQTITTQNASNTYGTFVLTADGDYTFTPAPNFSGTAQFAYKTCDNKGACAMATLYVYTKDAGVNLGVSMLALPTQISGTKTVTVNVTVFTGNTASNGSAVYVFVNKSPNITLETYEAATTNALGQAVQNADWSYDGDDASRYRFKLGGVNNKTVIAASSASTFSCKFTFTGVNVSGSDNITANIFEGSGGDNDNTNNSDTETIKYNRDTP